MEIEPTALCLGRRCCTASPPAKPATSPFALSPRVYPFGAMKRHSRIAADAVMLTIAERLPPRYRGVYAEGSEPAERGRRALDAGWVTPGSSAYAPPGQRARGLGGLTSVVP